MPFNVSETIEIDRPAGDVWPYLIAFEQVPLWEHGVIEVRQVTPGAPRVGTEMFARRLFAGRETNLGGAITAYEDGRSATMTLRGGPVDETIVAWTVEPIDGARSLVTFTASVRIKGPLRLFSPILPAMGRVEARKNLAKLKRRIGAGIPPRSDSPTPPAR